MKRRFVFSTALILMLFLTGTINGQDFRIRAGYQSAATFDNGNMVQGRLGSFYAGVFRIRPIGPGNVFHWGIGGEYSQQGHKENDDNLRKIHYISVPLALLLRFGPAYFQGGINTNFRIAEKVLLDGEDITDDANSEFLDFALHLGVGYNFGKLGLEARYHWGLLDVYEQQGNQYLQVGGSITF